MENYEELIQQVQSGKLSLLELISSQKDMAEDFKDFCEENNIEKSEDVAKTFISYKEQQMMDAQNL